MADAILIIGGDKAALKTAVKMRIQNPDKEIIVFIPNSIFPYRDFGINDFMSMGIRDFQAFKQRIREYYKSQFNINIFNNFDVKSILPDERKIVVWDHKRSAETYYEYGILILATGSVPVYPSVEGIDLDNVYFGDTAQEVTKILEWIESGEVNQAVVIGGNLSGIQTVQALLEKDILVTLVEERNHILPEFDVEIGEMVCKHLKERGIEVITGQKVLTLIGNVDGRVVEVHTPEHIIACQIVIWITDRKPDVELVEASGLSVEDGAVVINGYMETNTAGIYIVGHCANEEELCTAVLNIEKGKLFDFHIAKAGPSKQKAMEAGYNAESVFVAGYDDPMHSQGAREVMAILLVDRDSRKLLGVQLVGEAPVEKYADFISALIAKEGTIDDLAKMSSSCNSMEFMLLLSNAMLDKLDKGCEMISPVSFYSMKEDPDLIILDTRTEAEVTISKIPGAVNIPLEKLDLRKEELDKAKNIVIIAKGYIQARQAYEILLTNGFDNIKILEGGIAGYPYKLE